jgi:hypothetical protein
MKINIYGCFIAYSNAHVAQNNNYIVSPLVIHIKQMAFKDWTLPSPRYTF